MSLLFSYGDCSLISHEIYLNEIYASHCSDGLQYKIRSDIFDLNVPYRQQNTGNETWTKKRQRKIIGKSVDKVINEYPNEYELITKLKEKTEEFMKICCEREFLLNHHTNEQGFCQARTNERLKHFLNEWKSIEHPQMESISGDNDSDEVTVFETNSRNHLLPPKCKFFNIDIKKLDAHFKFSKTFDLITLDPPWWNKYVRRSRKTQRDNGYEMLSNDDIAEIPISKLIKVDRTLVAIWCTNAPSTIQAVREQLLAKWNLKLVATWFWIKITKYGRTICEFDLPLKKQPFERIFIACHNESIQDFKIPDEKLIFSIPSAIHSHKPPLHDLFRTYLIETDDEKSFLELFARYLLPNCTSIGLEVLKLQNLQLFSNNFVKR